ncbi:hypothetical protein AYI68_g63 [Smittium mucronatum]|uniref:Uncharacterized protein n=1 Tax=Smittium mucronatum TaxID=133383 RepID=A0A1R0H9G6_9FUNG|nr:hypothetical protein AYI68_g5006 [Smittium mucronatum]OLY85744.1 hypothetical protein AYI68_g63 [Smittium mucronatum]
MFNPIMNAWSALKADIKKKYNNLLFLEDGDPEGHFSQVEWTTRLIEFVINDSMDVITPEMHKRFIEHTNKFYSWALELGDMDFGA